MTALDEWREALASWALPEEILANAPVSPWTYPSQLFRQRAEAALSEPPSPSAQRALDALPEGGTVLDVGSGAGAASLALSRRAGRIVAVDQSETMLASFEELASQAGIDHATVVGAWPEIASYVEPADVVVCNHVLYNAADLEPFVRPLDGHALRRVVCEMTAEHPRAEENDLWMRFHGLKRPTRPTADDAERAIRELGIDVQHDDWTSPRRQETLDDIVGRTRVELALTPDRDPEIREALNDRLVVHEGGWVAGADRRLVTLWWDVSR